MNDDELAASLQTGGPGEDHGPAEDLRNLLADSATWAEPRPGGADAFLQAIQAEPSPAETGLATRSDPALLRGGPPPGRRLLLAAAAGIVALVALGGLLLFQGGGEGEDEAEFELAGSDLAPGASGEVVTSDLPAGVAINVEIDGLPPAGPGQYYQGWVKGPEGSVTVGTFHMRGGDGHVELWSGVELDRYPTLTITLQEEGAGAESSGEVVLSGDIGP